MSLEAMVWALGDAPVENVNEFATLGVLADKADADGCGAFPSVPTIADRTTISERSVQRALKAMTERGLIAEGDQTAARYLRIDRKPVVYDLMIPFSWFPNVLRINEDRAKIGRSPLTPENRPDLKEKSSGCQTVTPDDSGFSGHGVTVSPERGDTQSFAGCQTVTRTSPLNRSEGTGNTLSADAEEKVADPEMVDHLCKALVAAIKNNGVKRQIKITPQWRTAAAKLLADYTVQEIEDVMVWAQADDFWCANTNTMAKLHRNFDQLVLRSKRAPGNPKSEQGKKAHDELMSRRLEAMDALEQQAEASLGRALTYTELAALKDRVNQEVQ